MFIFLETCGISSTLSPCEIITGVKLKNYKHCVIPFGAFVHTHEYHDNSLSPCTIDDISLWPTGNYQEGHYFLSLQIGHCTNRLYWTMFPITDDAIYQVYHLPWRKYPSDILSWDWNDEPVSEDYANYDINDNNYDLGRDDDDGNNDNNDDGDE